MTKRENQVMSVLWNSEKPLSAQEIKSENENLSIYTIQQVLQRLLKMGYIRVAEVGQSTKVLMRLYAPVLTRPEYIQFSLGYTNTGNLVSHLIQDTTSLDELNQLEDLIQKQRKKLEG